MPLPSSRQNGERDHLPHGRHHHSAAHLHPGDALPRGVQTKMEFPSDATQAAEDPCHLRQMEVECLCHGMSIVDEQSSDNVNLTSG